MDTYNPSYLNFTLDATVDIYDDAAQLMAKAEAVKYVVGPRATEKLYLDLDLRYAMGRAIVDVVEMRKLMDRDYQVMCLLRTHLRWPSPPQK